MKQPTGVFSNGSHHEYINFLPKVFELMIDVLNQLSSLTSLTVVHYSDLQVSNPEMKSILSEQLNNLQLEIVELIVKDLRERAIEA